VDVPGGECHEGIGLQAEKLRPPGRTGETAAELPCTDTRDAHFQRLAQASTREESQANVVADLEPADAFVQLDIVDAFASPQFVDIFDLDRA
jgi:hypothetical protein